MIAVLCEALARLAAKAGVTVSDGRLVKASGKPALVLRRFDRQQSERVPFLSNEHHSYLEFVDVLRQHGAAPKQDMHELWRRIIFSILIFEYG